jgi:hypothetical protein
VIAAGAAIKENNNIGAAPRFNNELPKIRGRKVPCQRTANIRIIPMMKVTTGRTLNSNEIICEAG